jgi:hypothetical protein
MGETNVKGLLKVFEFEKKRELERYCRNTVISGSDFADLILACECSGVPFLHRINYRDIVPDHLFPSDSERKALEDNGPGLLGPEAAKAVRKMGQLFEERRYLVGHMFYTLNLSIWHFFCFDQRDLEDRRPNHWKEGAHVHFMNWLWPKQDAQSVWSNFVNGNYRPGNSIHLRWQMRDKDA